MNKCKNYAPFMRHVFNFSKQLLKIGVQLNIGKVLTFQTV